MPPSANQAPSSPAPSLRPNGNGNGTGNAEALKRQLRWVTLAWVFGLFWMWTVTGSTMTKFALALGTPEWGFGILAALPFLATFLQLPASWYLERRGNRKQLFIISASIGRAMWVFVALIPWLLPGLEKLWWPAMAFLLLLSHGSQQIGSPACMAILSDLIPRRVRGRYMAFRQGVSQPIALLATLGIGVILDQAEGAALTTDGSIVLHVTSAILAIAGVFGLIDILCFLRVGDPNRAGRSGDGEWLGLVRNALADRNFRRYLGYNITFVLGVAFLGQYVWLFALKETGLSNTFANMCLIAIPGVVRLIAYPIWGRLVDRLGKKPVLIIAGLLCSFGPLGWFFVISGDPYSFGFWRGYTLTLISPFAWCGVELANLNFMLDMGSTRKGRRGGTAYLAVNSIATAIGGTLSGLMGAGIAYLLSEEVLPTEFRVEIPAIGFVMTYHGVLFAVSMGLRFAAVGWALTLHEPRATGTRAALAYMTSSLYFNTRQAVLMPTRMVGSLWKWTYRLGARR